MEAVIPYDEIGAVKQAVTLFIELFFLIADLITSLFLVKRSSLKGITMLL